MKKVLFISYYWPPAGGAPVQRILKFVQYLQKYDWQPVILTIDKGDFPFIDESLTHEVDPDIPVYRSSGLSLHRFLKRLAARSNKNFIPYGFTDSSKATTMEKLSRWVKYNVIPDTRIPWYFSSVRRAIDIVKKENIDLIFSSSPPQTNHIIAARVARQTGLPWVADFRDPWTDVFWLQDRSIRMGFIHRIDRWIEKRTMRKMDAIITVSRYYASLLGKKTDHEVITIPNGFDQKYFSDISYSPGKRFKITFSGSMSKEQDPSCFFDAIELIKSDKDFMADLEIIFEGNFPPFLHEVVANRGIKDNVIFTPYTRMQDAIKTMIHSDLLLLIIPNTTGNHGILSLKVFDYIGSGRPILAYGPINGDAARLINEMDAGVMFSYSDAIPSANHIRNQWLRWKAGEVIERSTNTAGYSRLNLAGNLAKVFDDTITSKSHK